uniref:Putative secreted protein n=1 Tax=Amblyomma americanum TaxID=6943 RepID=A0A0C9R4T9_AMBAM
MKIPMLFLAVVLVTMRYIETGFALNFAEFTLDRSHQSESDFNPSGSQGSSVLRSNSKGVAHQRGSNAKIEQKVVFQTAVPTTLFAADNKKYWSAKKDTYLNGALKELRVLCYLLLLRFWVKRN